MEVFKQVGHNPHLALALGFFDGVHLAHQKLILHAVKFAKENGIKSAVVTFSENPTNYFAKEKIPNITSTKEKLALFEALGVDFAYVLDFEEFIEMDALSYLQEVIVKNFSPMCIAVGYNHTFGRGKEGNSKLLANYQKHFGYDFYELPMQKIESCLISSTNIRKMLSEGYIKNANCLLGRSFSVRNNVVKGQRLARQLGFPTANVVWPSTQVKLKHGVYFGYVVVDKTYPALINWGVRPTVAADNEEILEAHILNYDRDIYGEIVKVGFLAKIRDEMKFNNLDELREQILTDFEVAQKCARLT